MEPSQFFFIILPLATIIAILVVVVFYLARKTEETDYEKEIRGFDNYCLRENLTETHSCVSEII